MPVTNTDITLRFFVDDISATIALYDKIQVERSTGSSTGPWEAITADAAESAVLVGEEDGPFLLNGKTLELKVGGVSQVSVTFTDPDPVTTSQAAAAITTALGTLGTASDQNNRVKITTTATGTGASIQITGGTGYSILGFQVQDPYNFSLGRDAHVSLVSGVQDYEYIDHNGSSTYWYRIRYYNTSSGAATEWQPPFPADKVYVLPITETISGTCHLVDLEGKAVAHQKIHIINVFDPSRRTVGSSTYGVMGERQTVETDSNGFASVRLVRGSRVDVVWEGSSIRRRIQVPTTGTEFDLLDPSLADDEFGIHVPSWPTATRIP